MAEGLFNTLIKNAKAESAWTDPSDKINSMAIEVMREKWIDISSQYTKELTLEMINNAYRVITMGCVDKCPYTPINKTIKRDIPDPKDKEKYFFIEVRNLIENKILDLVKKDNLTL